MTPFVTKLIVVGVGLSMAVLGKIILDDEGLTVTGLGLVASGSAALGAALVRRPGDRSAGD